MRKWKPCPAVCDKDDFHSFCNQCSFHGDRMSASVMYGEMGEREDRKNGGIPLVSYDSGMVLDASKLNLLCVFGGDGATLNNNCNPPGKHGRCVPGCGDPPLWCDIHQPLLMNNCPCGFVNCNGRPRPWKPEHLGYVMEQHRERGVPYKTPQFHSGYNEVVFDSAKWPMPHAVLAFFVVEGSGNREQDEAREVHAAFLKEFKLTAAQMPLLRLRPKEWDAPFEVIPT